MRTRSGGSNSNRNHAANSSDKRPTKAVQSSGLRTSHSSRNRILGADRRAGGRSACGISGSARRDRLHRKSSGDPDEASMKSFPPPSQSRRRHGADALYKNVVRIGNDGGRRRFNAQTIVPPPCSPVSSRSRELKIGRAHV